MAASGGRSRLPRRRVDGVLLLDKPAGLSSNAALQRAKRLFAAEKAGHTGTLDPLATGLLPLCFGDATKFAQALLDAPKEYVATVRFGIATTTATPKASRRDVRRGVFARRARVGVDAFRRPDRADPSGVRGAQIPRPQLLRVRARRDRHSARRRDLSRSPPSSSSIGAARRGAAVASGKGTYIRVLAEDIARRAFLLCAPRGAAAHRLRAVFARGRGDDGRVAGDGRAGAGFLLLASRRPAVRRRAARRRPLDRAGPRGGSRRRVAARAPDAIVATARATVSSGWSKPLHGTLRSVRLARTDAKPA
jgi:hypothetical protein